MQRSADPSRSAFARILAALSRSGRNTNGEGRPGGNHASAAADVPGPASPRGAMAPILIAFLLSLVIAKAAMACPACESAVSSSQETPGGSGKLVRGYARSIYVLMAAPYLLFGGVTFAIVRTSRRVKKPGEN